MAYNFFPGPAVLPPAALQEAAAQLVDFHGQGMSIVEMSHRGQVYESVHQEAMALCRQLYALPEEFQILFLQGGASTQFAMVPLNLIREGNSADYICTGSWSQKAMAEVEILGKSCRIAGSSEDRNFRYIPTPDQLDLDGRAEYVHITTNNSIYGTQYVDLPDTGEVWLVADMSSDLLSRPLSWNRVGLAYGGAQKNAGIAGLTVVCVRQELLGRASGPIPTMLRYSTHAESGSRHNTPPTFAIYMLGLVLRWIADQGGLSAVDAQNRRKAALLYQEIDASKGFYCGHAEPGSRSLMNVCFTLGDRALEPHFCAVAEEEGLMGLKGHRAVGGIRASIYNAMSVEGCQALAGFMRDFAARKG